jgi:predicted RND superfamily exporter protein
MNFFANAVIRHKKAVIALFSISGVISAVLFFTVHVNYNMADYLPPEAQSTQAVSIMGEEFPSAMPNATVMAENVSVQEALNIKRELLALPHVTAVMWLDDVVSMTVPLEMADQATVESYYKDGNALYTVTVVKGEEKAGVSEIREVLGETGFVTGDAADIEYVQTATGAEVINAMIILIPIIILILFLTTSSWIEPVLFLAAIGMSVVINMGTNAMFPSVSFLTNAVTPILQLAVSLDYAIFLLHSFGAHRKNGGSVEDAMREAMKESFSTVAASASTTLFGFMALLFMDFRLGADLGISLAKGIIFSFVSVMVFLPAFTLTVYKAIDKTRHKEIMPTFSNIHSFIKWLAVPAVVFVALVIVPCFLGQSRTGFVYGYQAAAKSMRGTDSDITEETFGHSTTMVLLVPKGDQVKEELLGKELKTLPYVKSVVSYAESVGIGIPADFLDKEIQEQFYSPDYARIIVYTDTPSEGEAAFATVENISATAKNYYPTGVFSAGQSANLYDIKEVVQRDNQITNMIAVVAIFLVLLVTFRSGALPFLLLLTIEAAIWINLAIPYFTGTSINYIGYLVLNTVQLGATVDYAILLTVTYLRLRKAMPKKAAIHAALGSSFRSILVSAATLATAGFTLAGTTSNPLIGDIGMLLGRGTLLSMTLVLVFLPALLTMFDGFIGKVTYRSAFFKEEKVSKNA